MDPSGTVETMGWDVLRDLAANRPVMDIQCIRPENTEQDSGLDEPMADAESVVSVDGGPMPLDHSPPSTPQDSDAGVLPPVDTTDDAFLSVSAGGYHSCGIQGDRSAVCWGRDNHGQSRAPTGQFRHISANYWHSCAITLAGEAQCWGDNEFGQADAPNDIIFESVTSGYMHSCGRTSEGAVHCWFR